MPKLSHWIGQYLIAVASMFVLLLAIDLMRGELPARAWPSALVWAAVASAIFVGSRYRNMRRGIECGICNMLDKK